MLPATEWSQAVLQSMRGRLSSLTRRVARLEACSGPDPEQPHRSHEGDDPFGPLLDALDAFNNEQRQAFDRLRRLEEAISVASAPPARRDSDPLRPLFDALESINGELTGFAARLARLEDTVQVQAPTRRPRLVRSPSAAATVRAARGRRVRKAVSRA
ncbi:hypothetical protein ACFW9F_00480 [Streptomyces sp. NPDC059506]|uniref:hypothetical protein n=1 Tax=Streptomyces sp. NPDC059506 TaxID=3347751 RepID=UPI003694DEBD